MFEVLGHANVHVLRAAVFVIAVLGSAISSQTATAADGVWVLQKTSTEISGIGPKADNPCYPNSVGSISDGSGTFTQDYAACGGAVQKAGKVTSKCVWQSPPQRITPLEKQSINATVSHTGDAVPLFGGEGISVRVGYRSGSDELHTSGRLDDPNAPKSASKALIFAFPNGRADDQSDMQVACSGAGGNGAIHYIYVFQAGAGPAPNSVVSNPPGADAPGKTAHTVSSPNTPPSSIGSVGPAAAITAMATVLGGLLAAFGAMTAAGMAGIGQGDIVSSLLDLLKGKSTSDGFDAWKQKGLAQGGQYVVRDNVGVVVPSDASQIALRDEMKRRLTAIDKMGYEPPPAIAHLLEKIRAGGPTPENLEKLRRFAHVLGDISQGENEGEGAKQLENAAWSDYGTSTAQTILTADQFAAGLLESRAAPWSHGMISGFAFGALQNLDKGVGGMIENGVLSALGSAAGSGVNIASSGNKVVNVIANTAGGAAIGAATEWVKGSSSAEIESAAQTGALLAGGMSLAGHFAEGAKGLWTGTKTPPAGAIVEPGEMSAPSESQLEKGNTPGETSGKPNAAQSASVPEDVVAPAKSQPPSEDDIKQALSDRKSAEKNVIGIKDQSPVVKELNETRHAEEGKEYVDERGALEQLSDTTSSRTAKQAPQDLQDAIINTREDKLYKPADDATIAAVANNPAVQAKMVPGDKLVMDTFSTPGKTGRSLGADRDARLVIQHADGTLEEVPRKFWEKQAYRDFYEHTSKLYPEGVTPETHPEVFKRVEELKYLKGGGTDAAGVNQGLADQEILHRAWAEEHNQLFTDKYQTEASRDNSDQFLRGQLKPPSTGIQPGGKPDMTMLDRVQRTQSVLKAQSGEQRLQDPEGFYRMWQEKSRFYENNPPEALAQSQKGIAEMMKLRDGYRQGGMQPPSLPPKIAQAMGVIVRAPTGVDASPTAIAGVNQQLKNLGFRDMNDAMSKVAGQFELFKWSKKVAS
jgi:hypothetical protein